MNSSLLIIIAFIVALAIGFFIGKMLSKAESQSQKSGLEERVNGLLGQIEQLKNQFQQEKNQFEKAIAQLNLEKENVQKEKEAFAIHLAKKENDFDNLLERNKEQKQEVEQLQEKFTKEFENLANKILEEKTNKFTEQNKENMKTILNPLQEKIQLFEKKVDDTHKESIDYHAALRQQILGLRDMNEKMSKETVNLTKALKGDSKMQGNWGELVLERVLERHKLLIPICT